MGNVLRAAMFASAAIVAFAAPASAELHGVCADCNDVNGITPTSINPPSFGFTNSPDSGTVDHFLLEILVPDNVSGAGSESITITGANTANASVTGSLFSSTAWTSGKLSAYLGIPINANPISAFLTDPTPNTQTFQPTADGYFDYQFDFGSVTFGSATDPTFTTSFVAPAGTIITAFTSVTTETCHRDHCTFSTDWTPTANSAAIIETSSGGGTNGGPVPEPMTLSLLGAGLAGAAALRRRRTKKPAA